MRPVHVALAAMSLALACGDPVGKSWLVERTRILGARASAESDPARASIANGERARLVWLVGAPAGAPRLTWAFAACAPPPGNLATPRCEGDLVASGQGTSDGSAEVPMTFDVPATAALDAEVLVVAAFCETTSVALDPRAFVATCPAGGDALLASATVRLDRAGRNLNPALADDAVRMNGAVIPRAANGRTNAPCTPDSPVAVAGQEHAFGLLLQGGERERFSGGLEALVLSHLVTAGELDRHHSAVEPYDDLPREVVVPWTPPSPDEVGPEGRLVEVFFVLRDGRGGAAFERRAICVRRGG